MTIQQIVIKRLKLFTKRRAVSMLDGNYDSIFRGKGVELDSLRPYIVGDNTKDIDWRATARTGSVHTRLYSPLRDQRILIICDTSSSMLLPTYTQANKLDAMYGLIVTLGMFVQKNRDLLAVCYADQQSTIQISKFANTNKHVEKLLRSVDVATHRTPPTRHTPLEALLQHAHHKLRQRTAVFIVSDALPHTDTIKPLLKKLHVKHQLFWLQIAPSWPFSHEVSYVKDFRDIESTNKVSKTLVTNKQLQKEWLQDYAITKDTLKKLCKATGTAFGNTEDPTTLPDEIRKMFMQAKKYAKQH